MGPLGGGKARTSRDVRCVATVLPPLRRVFDQLADSSRLSESALFRRAAQLTIYIYQWTKIAEIAGALGEARERERDVTRVDEYKIEWIESHGSLSVSSPQGEEELPG